MNKLLIFSCFILGTKIQQSYQQQDYTTPVPILKQIDRHNDDGSYTYGYEAADRSFKIETKYPSGEVFGKYGYLDDQGKLREIEYGASKRGFEPAGSDINVPPPTLTNNNPYPLGPNEIDDGQYREDPAVYYKDQKFNRPAVAPSRFSLDNFHQPQRPQYNTPPPQYYNPAPPPQPRYQQFGFQHQPPQFRQPPPPPTPPQPRYQSQYQPQYQQRSYQPQPQSQYPYGSLPQHHHPALKNLDIWSGSYSIDYTGRRK
ncbi:activating signal cointegrator 1 complex subunit 2 homolog [Bactrocera oleae]|uniref:activating signal cointegrator 1 complex subunit 2 homolog n=1 Tax=Bactrocera oleae TaxID=104688 RepID=UPI0006B84D85|nr:activating signal cointegrator 1 complex subunit 2 homolog isoform X2 [Bactrocera oleae]